MTDAKKTPDITALQEKILTWLKSRLESTSFQKIESTFNNLQQGAEDWEVFSTFSAVPRYTGKKPLKLTEAELEEAGHLRRGWSPQNWSLDQLGRTLLVLGLANRTREEFLDKLDKLFISADMGESIALYQALPLYPYPKSHQKRAAEGVRSNITSVFNVIAHNNPYPADFMPDEAWNQIVLKALFVGSPLYPITGLDRRANPELARILIEYAHERWSAGRVISPELWRPAGPFLDDGNIGEIKKVLDHPDLFQRQAALLALETSRSQAVRDLLEKHAEELKSLKKSGIGWKEISIQYHEN